MRPMGLFDLPDHLARLSATGDPLEVLAKVVDFEVSGLRWRRRWATPTGRRAGGRRMTRWPCSRFWCWRPNTPRVTSAWSS